MISVAIYLFCLAYSFLGYTLVGYCLTATPFWVGAVVVSGTLASAWFLSGIIAGASVWIGVFTWLFALLCFLTLALGNDVEPGVVTLLVTGALNATIAWIGAIHNLSKFHRPFQVFLILAGTSLSAIAVGVVLGLRWQSSRAG